MKLLKATPEKLEFHLGRREHQQLLNVLKLYPRVPPAYSRLSRRTEPDPADENQRLLEEALAEQRTEHKRLLQEFLARPETFQAHKAGFCFTLTRAEADWLLQVLNDIRVGSWIALGAPEDKAFHKISMATLPHIWAMETAGFFEMHLIEALATEQF